MSLEDIADDIGSIDHSQQQDDDRLQDADIDFDTDEYSRDIEEYDGGHTPEGRP